MRQVRFRGLGPSRLLSVAKKALGLVIMSLLCLVLFGSLPVQAADRISPQMQEQVLQILREHPEVIIESLQAYQQQQRQQLQQVQQAFLQEFKANPQEVIGKSPTTGTSESKTVLLEFSDFECPYCSQAHKTLKELIANHQGELKLVYKHFPLVQIHNEAMPAAKAAWAAGQQSKFWEYHDALFTHQNQLGEKLYVAIAKTLNLDLEQFTQDRNGDAANAAIEQDVQMANKLGINGTPFFVMNGEGFVGAVSLADIESKLAHGSKL